jgi:hypothetical protein
MMLRFELVFRDLHTDSTAMDHCMFLSSYYFINPKRNKLSAAAKIASSWLRGCLFCDFFAFALLAFLFLHNRATISFNSGLNIAKRRTSEVGATLVVTFWARSPNLVFNNRAITGNCIISLARAGKRCLLALGETIASDANRPHRAHQQYQSGYRRLQVLYN